MDDPPPLVRILNKKAASKKDLDESSYVAMAGLANEGIIEKIRKELLFKFKGQANPDLLDSTPSPVWIAYSYLFKKLPFRHAFDRYPGLMKFDGQNVDSFGITCPSQPHEIKIARQVAVIDHVNNDDFIIELKTQSSADMLILAKVQPGKSLYDTISMAEKRIAKAKPTEMKHNESLHIPVLDFDILKTYPELYKHPIRSANNKLNGTTIDYAAQAIRFRLDEKGAVIKSEFSVASIGGRPPRNFTFDKPFLVLLKRRKANRPYFALWVGNAELLIQRKEK